MHIIRSSIAAAALLVVAVTPVLADHGYWPEAGVVPAAVSEHRPYSEVAATPVFWGADCRGLAQTGEAETLDVYGHVLDADYALAVVLAQEDGVPVEGSFALTVFRNPRAGQFVWADADGDRTFAGRHEADAGLLVLCPRDRPARDGHGSECGGCAAGGFARQLDGTAWRGGRRRWPRGRRQLHAQGQDRHARRGGHVSRSCDPSGPPRDALTKSVD